MAKHFTCLELANLAFFSTTLSLTSFVYIDENVAQTIFYKTDLVDFRISHCFGSFSAVKYRPVVKRLVCANVFISAFFFQNRYSGVIFLY